MTTLPIPQAVGNVDVLRKFLNVTSSDWPLLLAWLIGTFMPSGPYPVLVLTGEQGSAKSTVTRVLRSLVDPSTVPLRSLPREERDLAITAGNSWVIALDNVSSLPPWLSDAISRLSTGGGFTTRELYTNSEEVLFTAARPVVLNGIGDIATRSDLLDRAIIVTLPNISDHKRRTEAAFWGEFEMVRPMVLTALITAVTLALRNAKDVRLDKVPRMADFVKWVVAAAPYIGLEPKDFLEAYAGNRRSVHELALESSPVGFKIINLAEELPDGDEWTGTATELLDKLSIGVGDTAQRRKDWPKSAGVLSGTLRRLAPNLRAVGIEVTWGGKGSGASKQRAITIRKVRISSSPSSLASHNTNPAQEWDDGDARDDEEPTYSNTFDQREAILGMPVKKAIEIWRSEGAPVIYLAPGENCLDLAKLLSAPGVSRRNLEAIRQWLNKQQDK